MESFGAIESTPLWDLSHASSFSQIADDDFLALLQKQFPTGNAATNYDYTDGINPQNISRYSLPSITPPSEDSSPSPPNMNGDGGNDEGTDPVLKRKASDEDFEEGPSQKSQHTSGNKKSSSMARRKSLGTTAPPKDETRLLKRKEQNRAAQRAFRERKEKHVKDLEDKVAALEAKNEQALSENENLRDLLSRLQNENLSLKQSSFTFAVPKTAGTSTENAQASTSFASQSPAFSASSPAFSASSRLSVAQSPASTRSPTSPKAQNPLDWSSLTSFDPAMLNLLDDSPQTTATDGAMQMDFGFGATSNPGLTNNTPYTTIASNPMFMSFASTFDSASPAASSTETHSGYNFDMNGLSTWSPANPNEQSLDDLLGAYMARSDTHYGASSSASDSPITHHSTVNNINTAASRSPAFSTTSSPSSITSDPLFDTPRDGSASDSDIGHEGHNESDCPKTKGELVKRIESSGPSPFAPATNTNKTLRKSSDEILGTMIMCEGSNFPKTQQSDQNIEVLSAWRSITSNPKFKVRYPTFPYDPSLPSSSQDIDINELCSEFTDKARCDGTKVVLEPQGVSCILKNLSNPRK
ncbi:hypothetical protein BDZ94DRAFT_1230954 [Collybia nuda]|uniref:BZIP domain-containing protein n=1 Tax=Collybia nuda TaxID=64659 RepID=A0A9P5XR50_9AGAR|nr:hypothetical protein BDZ94DRAFT_1230954 [Collybia nuda]